MSCSKCGSNQISGPVYTDSFRPFGAWNFGYTTAGAEALVYHCQVCGYYWPTKTKDQEKQEVQKNREALQDVMRQIREETLKENNKDQNEKES